MTDHRLRTLERRYQAGEIPQDDPAWLRERLRSGELDRERVELAAYCGSEGALGLWRSWDRSMPNHDTGKIANALYRVRKYGVSGCGLPQWLQGLARWGNHVMARAALAAGRVALLKLPWLDSRPGADGGSRYLSVLRALEAAEAWLECPCEEHREAALAHQGRPAGMGVDPRPNWWWAPSLAIQGKPSALRQIRECARIVTEATVREAICADLVGFALQ